MIVAAIGAIVAAAAIAIAGGIVATVAIAIAQMIESAAPVEMRITARRQAAANATAAGSALQCIKTIPNEIRIDSVAIIIAGIAIECAAAAVVVGDAAANAATATATIVACLQYARDL